jgi:hypothetical protein
VHPDFDQRLRSTEMLRDVLNDEQRLAVGSRAFLDRVDDLGYSSLLPPIFQRGSPLCGVRPLFI